MGNQSGYELRDDTAAFARRPTDKEMIILYQLQKKLFKRLVESPEHLGMLQRYWDLSFGSKQTAPAFERRSAFWCREGGFSSDNPADDLRGMGELGLQCLLFFVETYPGESAMMKRVRGGYPFVKAALAVTRALCEVFRLVDEDNHMGRFPVTRTLYWQLLESDTSFYELFALLFLLFEELYCEEVAARTSLQDEPVCSTAVVAKLVDAAKLRLLRALVKAPMRVDDLRELCGNALHALNRRQEWLATRPLAVTADAAAGIAAAPVSLWKQHETQRKSMREVCKNWREDATPRRRCRTYANSHSTGECLYRLQPREPEISFSPPEVVGASLHSESLMDSSEDGGDIKDNHDNVGDNEEEKQKDDSECTEERSDNGLPLGCCSEPEVEANLFEGLVLSKTSALSLATPVSPSKTPTAAAFVGNKADYRHRRAASVS